MGSPCPVAPTPIDRSGHRVIALGKHARQPLKWDCLPLDGWNQPKKFPAEFKRDVVAVARRGDLRIPEVAVDFWIAEEEHPALDAPSRH